MRRLEKTEKKILVVLQVAEWLQARSAAQSLDVSLSDYVRNWLEELAEGIPHRVRLHGPRVARWRRPVMNRSVQVKLTRDEHARFTRVCWQVGGTIQSVGRRAIQALIEEGELYQ